MRVEITMKGMPAMEDMVDKKHLRRAIVSTLDRGAKKMMTRGVEEHPQKVQHQSPRYKGIDKTQERPILWHSR